MDTAHYLLLVCLPPSDSQAVNISELRDELVTRLTPFQFSSPKPIFRYPVYGDPAGFAHVHQLRTEPATAGQLTWDIVAAAYNTGRPADDPRRLHVDNEDAYHLSNLNLDGRLEEWEIGGRWRGHFRVKPDAVDDRRLINPRIFIDPDDPTREILCCDGGPRQLLDFDAMRGEAMKHGAWTYQQWQRIVRGTPPALGFNHYLERNSADPKGYPLKRAERDYYAQPRVAAVARYEASLGGDRRRSLLRLTPHEDVTILLFQEGIDAVLARAVAAVSFGFALLTLDGRWLWQGWPDGFDVIDLPDFLQHLNTYSRDAAAHLGSLRDNDRLIAVDCTA